MKFKILALKMPKRPEVKLSTPLKVLIGVLIFGNIWFSVSKIFLQKRMNKEKNALIEAYEVKLTENIEEQLRLVTTTFVWSIRSEMMRDNYDQVDLYFRQLVKEDDRITEVIAVDEKGKMVVSTNKRYEDRPFEAVYDKSLLQNNDVNIVNQDKQFKIVAPIMALNNRIGTLFMMYEPDEQMLKVIPETEKKNNEDNSDSIAVEKDTLTEKF